MIKKVLILFSWNDFVSRNRFDMMLESPLLKEYEIHQCFAVGAPHERTTSKKLLQHLKRKINEIKPELLMLNSGVAFMENPYVFIEAFQGLKRAFSHLRFGIEKQSSLEHYYRDSKVFEDSEEMHDLEKLFFYTVFNRQE